MSETIEDGVVSCVECKGVLIQSGETIDAADMSVPMDLQPERAVTRERVMLRGGDWTEAVVGVLKEERESPPETAFLSIPVETRKDLVTSEEEAMRLGFTEADDGNGLVCPTCAQKQADEDKRLEEVGFEKSPNPAVLQKMADQVAQQSTHFLALRSAFPNVSVNVLLNVSRLMEKGAASRITDPTFKPLDDEEAEEYTMVCNYVKSKLGESTT